jgi:hypothetical protein
MDVKYSIGSSALKMAEYIRVEDTRFALEDCKAYNTEQARWELFSILLQEVLEMENETVRQLCALNEHIIDIKENIAVLNVKVTNIEKQNEEIKEIAKGKKSSRFYVIISLAVAIIAGTLPELIKWLIAIGSHAPVAVP